jgi:membrane associated rhomboid family serine protease
MTIPLDHCPSREAHMHTPDYVPVGIIRRFGQYFRHEWRRTFSVDYQLSELKKLARLCRVPPAGTLALCCLMVGAFVVQTKTGELRWTQLYGTVPPGLHHLSSITKTAEGQAIPVWLTLFTYLFVHGSWDHVIGNTVAGWMIGNLAERRMGTLRFLLAYVAAGVIGAFGVAWLLPSLSAGPRYGASLAWCYVLGAYWALLALDTIRRKGRAMLVLSLEAATVILIGWRLAEPTSISKLESVLWVHPLPIVFGWFTVRIWSGVFGNRISPTTSR